MRATCSKSGCSRRTFMDEDFCTKHEPFDIPWWAIAWVIFCVVFGGVVGAVIIWAVVQLVQWITAQ